MRHSIYVVVVGALTMGVAAVGCGGSAAPDQVVHLDAAADGSLRFARSGREAAPFAKRPPSAPQQLSGWQRVTRVVDHILAMQDAGGGAHFAAHADGLAAEQQIGQNGLELCERLFRAREICCKAEASVLRRQYALRA